MKCFNYVFVITLLTINVFADPILLEIKADLSSVENPTLENENMRVTDMLLHNYFSSVITL